MANGKLAAAAVALSACLALAACGGGGGSAPTAQPAPQPAPEPAPQPAPQPQPAPEPDPQPAPQPQPDPPPAPQPPEPPPAPQPVNIYGVTPKAGRGVATVPGVDRIPLDALRVTKREMAEMFAVMEFKASPHLPDAFSPPGNRRTPHSDDVRRVACHSYIEACADPFGPDAPLQFHLGVRYEGLEDGVPEGYAAEQIHDMLRNSPTGTITVAGKTVTERDNREQIRTILRDLPQSVKIVSVSYTGSTPVGILGADLPFASIQPTGNNDRDTFLTPGRQDNPELVNIRAAIAADRMLLVSGYSAPDAMRGIYKRGIATGCIGEGYSEGCIWAPGRIKYPHDAPVENQVVNMGGTSASAPHVAASLASVLAVFPETTPQNLVRLAKACAIPTPSLPGGVGRADFTCMTTMGDNGEWRVVSAEAFARLVSPSRMNAMVFPGDARITGTFVGRAGKPVELGTSVGGAFSFASGIPGFAPGRTAGFFPVVADGGGNPSVGGGYMTEGGLFAAVAMGDRDGFFGLDGRYRYSGTRAADMAVGHRHAYARFTRQWSAAPPLIGAVRGDALGVTAEYSFGLGAATSLSVAGHADRFVGGRADTVFGPVEIGASPWNRSAAVSLDHSLPNGARLSLSANRHWLAHGNDTGLSFGYRHRF